MNRSQAFRFDVKGVPLYNTKLHCSRDGYKYIVGYHHDGNFKSYMYMDFIYYLSHVTSIITQHNTERMIQYAVL